MPTYTKFTKILKQTRQDQTRGLFWVLYRDGQLIEYKNIVSSLTSNSRYIHTMNVENQTMILENYVDDLCEFSIRIENGFLIFRAHDWTNYNGGKYGCEVIDNIIKLTWKKPMDFSLIIDDSDIIKAINKRHDCFRPYKCSLTTFKDWEKLQMAGYSSETWNDGRHIKPAKTISPSW